MKYKKHASDSQLWTVYLAAMQISCTVIYRINCKWFFQEQFLWKLDNSSFLFYFLLMHLLLYQWCWGTYANFYPAVFPLFLNKKNVYFFELVKNSMLLYLYYDGTSSSCLCVIMIYLSLTSDINICITALHIMCIFFI